MGTVICGFGVWQH